MKLLLLGFSSLAKRRIVPALPGWEVTIATRRSSAVAEIAALGATAIVGFDEALATKQALVYVATDNADHELWVMAALRAGHHVVVDKPAVLTLAAAEAAVALATKQGVCLAEATVWDRHPQVDAFVELARDAYRRVHAAFIVPMFKPDNFRTKPERGGGAVLDLGPYAASVIRRVFGEAPRSLSVVRHHTGPIDTSFTVLADFGARGVFTGQFAFGGEYVNRISLNADGLNAEIDRVFTIPPQQPGKLTLREHNAWRDVETAPCDSFARFMTEVADHIAKRSFAGYAADLLFDARVVAALMEKP
jgi:dTDP-3,4-didehydro-2,6-dideoxy-alpha-D-glucose 3-reductase